jgi:hypothetical protein
MAVVEQIGGARQEKKENLKQRVIDALVALRNVFYKSEKSLVEDATNDGIQVNIEGKKTWIPWRKVDEDDIAIGESKGSPSNGGQAQKAA